jgi:hypothetical protein
MGMFVFMIGTREDGFGFRWNESFSSVARVVLVMSHLRDLEMRRYVFKKRRTFLAIHGQSQVV